MVYGLISLLKSLLIRSSLVIVIYMLSIYLKNLYFKEYLDYLYITLLIIFIERAIYYTRYWKYIILPYSLNLHSSFKADLINRNMFLDRFIELKKKNQKRLLDRVRCKELKRFTLEYKNFVSIDINKYRAMQEQILHFLKLIHKKYELKIYPKGNKSVILSFYKLPEFYEVDYTYFKPNKIFLGMYENGLYYRDLDTLDHHLIVGESGSGKSTLLQLLNINFLFNLSQIEKLYMIDLKGGVELKRYEHLNKVDFISDIENLNNILDSVLQDLKDTQKKMIHINTRKLNEYRIIVFDEIGAISSHPDKKLREEIFSKLALISMQGRSSGILIFAFAQKIENSILPSNIVNNLQSRILLKNSNDFCINIIDLKENIRDKITWVEVQDFNKGRGIYKDGLTSEKSLIQFPFISDRLLNNIVTLDMEQISLDLQNRKSL